MHAMVRITINFVLNELTDFREIKRKCMETIKENTNFPDTNRRTVSLLALHLFCVAIFICQNPGAHPHVSRSTGTLTPHLKTECINSFPQMCHLFFHSPTDPKTKPSSPTPRLNNL